MPQSGSTKRAGEEPVLLVASDADAGVAVITLNRPARRNALNESLLRELAAALRRVGDDDSIRAVILTGAGGAFCSGADTRELAGSDTPGPHALGPGGPEALRRGFARAQEIILGLQRMEKPVVAAINGPAVGAGLDLACACDLRVASTSARFMAAYVRIGLFPGYGGVWLYPRLVGLGKAAEMLYTGDSLDAEEARRIGLVNRLVEPAQLHSAAMELARRIAAGPPIAIRLSKLMLYKGLGMDLETAMQMAAAAETITLSSQDHREGLEAFREGRAPRYGGR